MTEIIERHRSRLKWQESKSVWLAHGPYDIQYQIEKQSWTDPGSVSRQEQFILTRNGSILSFHKLLEEAQSVAGQEVFKQCVRFLKEGEV